MSCAEGLEAAILARSCLLDATHGDLDLHGELKDELPILCISGCKSLFDNLQKDGQAKAPAEKRLVIDLAAIKQQLRMWEQEGDICQLYKLPVRWVPTELMLADALTKIMTGEKLRETLQEGYLQLPFVDGRQAWRDLTTTHSG